MGGGWHYDGTRLGREWIFMGEDDMVGFGGFDGLRCEPGGRGEVAVVLERMDVWDVISIYRGVSIGVNTRFVTIRHDGDLESMSGLSMGCGSNRCGHGYHSALPFSLSRFIAETLFLPVSLPPEVKVGE